MDIYEVVFIDGNGIHQRSRIFQRIANARKWCKWLMAQKFAKQAIIYRGGAGGEIVE